MNARELIKILESADPNAPVLIDGYEDGLHDLVNVFEIAVDFNNSLDADNSNSAIFGPHNKNSNPAGRKGIVFTRLNICEFPVVFKILSN